MESLQRGGGERGGEGGGAPSYEGKEEIAFWRLTTLPRNCRLDSLTC